MAMHPAPIIGNNLILFRQRLLHSAFSHACEITLSGVDNGAHTPQQCVDIFANFLKIEFQSLLSDNVTVPPAQVLKGDGTNVPAVALASIGSYNGTNTITEPSPQVTALFKKTTALAGKQNRGRTYFPFLLAESQIDEAGRIDSSISVPLSEAAQDYLEDLVSDSTPMVISNKTFATDPITGKRYVTHIEVGAEVTGWNCEDFVATQRRRLQRS